MCGKLGQETQDKSLHLFIRNGKELSHSVHQGFQNQSQRRVEADLCRFGCHEPEQFAYGTVIGIGTLSHGENHIPNADNGQMAGKRIEGRAVALLQKFEVLLAGFEIHLNVPPDAVAANDLIFGNIHVRRDQRNPVLTPGSIPDEDDPDRDSGRDLPVLLLNQVCLDREQKLCAGLGEHAAQQIPKELRHRKALRLARPANTQQLPHLKPPHKVYDRIIRLLHLSQFM